MAGQPGGVERNPNTSGVGTIGGHGGLRRVLHGRHGKSVSRSAGNGNAVGQSDVDYRDLAADLLRRARALGADAADILVGRGHRLLGDRAQGRGRDAEGRGQQGARPARLRRPAHAPPATRPTSRRRPSQTLVRGDRGHGARDRARTRPPGFPTRRRRRRRSTSACSIPRPPPCPPPSASSAPAARRRRRWPPPPRSRTRRAATYGSGEGLVVLANTSGLHGLLSLLRRRRSPWCRWPSATAQMERDYWYTTGRGLGDLLAPEEVGRDRRRADAAPAGRAQGADLRGRRSCSTPRPRPSCWARSSAALSGYSVFRNATFLKDRLGEQVASPLLTLVDDGPAAARPGLAPLRRRGPAHAPQRAPGERRAPPLPLRLATRRARSARGPRAAPGAASAAAPRWARATSPSPPGDDARPSRSWARSSAASTSPTSSASASTSSPATTRRARSGTGSRRAGSSTPSTRSRSPAT